MGFTRTVSKACLVLAAVGGLAACQPGAPPAPPGPTARLRLVHVAPNADAIDVFLGGTSDVLIRGLDLGEASPYVEVAAGTLQLDVRPEGGDEAMPPAFTTPDISLEANQKYTAIATGRLDAPAGPEAFRVLVLQEAFAEPAPNAALVRIVHASPDAPEVGVDVGADEPDAPEVKRVEPFSATEPEGIAVPADEALRVGLAAGGAHLTTFTLPPLPAGTRAFIIAMGQTAAMPNARDGFALLPVAQSGALPVVRQDPAVFALHASPDAPAVDAFAEQVELGDNLSFGQLSPVIRVSPGAQTLELFAHAPGPMRPGTAPAATLTTPQLRAGERYLAIITGFFMPAPGGQPLQLVALRDAMAVDPNAAHLRAVHASPDAPPVDIGPLVNDAVMPLPGWANLKFAAASPEEGASLPPGPVTLGVAPTGQPQPIARFSFELVAGERAFIVAAGALTPAAPSTRRFGVVQVRTDTFPWQATAAIPSKPPLVR